MIPTNSKRNANSKCNAAKRFPRRSGMSLLEVILAVAILSLAAAGLGELIRGGLRSAEHARLETMAQLMCENKLAEITAGLVSPEPISGAAVEVDPDAGGGVSPRWLYSVELQPVEQEGMVALRVTVIQNVLPQQRPVSVSVVQWIVDPGIELPEPTEEEDPTDADGGTSES
ncbi:MAG: type II secretion system GspH family protein [Planctomycetales bacterium]